MLLFSLVRTTAADSCGDGNATATATSEAKIMIVFILLLVCVSVRLDRLLVKYHKTDGVRLKTVKIELIIDKFYVGYFIAKILTIILQREMVRLFHRFDSVFLCVLRCF